MSVINTQPLAGSSGQATGYNIERSLRFRKAAPAYLTRTPASSGSTTTWTVSFWYKYSETGVLFEAGDFGNRDDGVVLGSSGNLEFYIYNSTYTGRLKTTQLLRDPSAWYHITCVWDTTNATSTERMRMYINGVRVTAFDIATYPSLNATSGLNTSSFAHGIGAWANASYPAGGYMADFRFIDGQALNASSFGENDTTTGVWKPKRFSGTYGTNGFYLPFTDVATTSGSNAGLGKDFSGNGNYWNTTNISVTAGYTYDSMTDVPTLTSATAANYSTFNPVGGGGGSLTYGNLRSSTSSTTPDVGTMAMLAGKWYCEVTVTTSSNPRVGVYDIGAAAPTNFGGTANGWALINSPSRIFNNGATTTYGTFAGSNGDVVMMAYDAGTGNLWFGANGSWFASGNPATATSPSVTGLTGKTLVPAVASGTGANVFDLNCGQRPFAYTPPSGFKALNTYNLPDSTIVAGNKVMDVALWTGTNSTGNLTVSNLNFKPDLVWSKIRNNTFNHQLTDSVRGVNKTLQSNTTAVEDTTNVSGAISSFNSNGFTATAGSSDNWYWNYLNGTYAGWAWQAGQGTTSSNTSGSITSTVSVNPSAGFSIVTWTGNGSNSTVGHGLGVAPKFIVVKNRGTTDGWHIYHVDVSATKILQFDTSAPLTLATAWNNTSPTSSVFSLGTASGVNANTNTYVAYCWAEIAGFSKFGSYTGNGSTDGPFIYLGFKPKYVMFKNISVSGAWEVYDTSRNTFNTTDNYLLPNSSGAEGVAAGRFDYVSNGVKVRNTGGSINGSGNTIIYAAFAENPFKNSLAR